LPKIKKENNDVQKTININCVNRFSEFLIIHDKYAVKLVLKFCVFKLKIKGFIKQKLQKLTNSKIFKFYILLKNCLNRMKFLTLVNFTFQ